MPQALVFRLEEEDFALELRFIQEVVDSAELHFIPRAPDFFLGAVNFHGIALPVLDLGRFLGFPGEELDSRFIALTGKACSMALAVTQVQKIVPLDPETLMPCPDEKNTAKFIHGVFETENTLVNLLNLHELLKEMEFQFAATGGGHGAKSSHR